MGWRAPAGGLWDGRRPVAANNGWSTAAGCGQRDDEGARPSPFGVGPVARIPSVSPRELAHDEEPEARAFRSPGYEALKQSGLQLKRDPRARVADLHLHALCLNLDDSDVHRLGTVAERVCDQVVNRLSQPVAVAANRHQVGRVDDDPRFPAISPCTESRCGDDLGDVDGIESEVEGARLEPRRRQEISDHASQTCGARRRSLSERRSLALSELRRVFRERLGTPGEHAYGATQFVRGHCEELRLSLGDVPQPAVGEAKLLEDAAPVRHVPGDLGKPDVAIPIVVDSRDDDVGPEVAAVFADAPSFLFVASVAQRPEELVLGVTGGSFLLRIEDPEVLPDDFVRAVTLDPLRADVPAHDMTVGIEHEDGVVLHGFDEKFETNRGVLEHLPESLEILCSGGVVPPVHWAHHRPGRTLTPRIRSGRLHERGEAIRRLPTGTDV